MLAIVNLDDNFCVFILLLCRVCLDTIGEPSHTTSELCPPRHYR